jgi:hypothetical protein
MKEQRYFTYPLRCLRVSPGVREPLVEYHCSTGPQLLQLLHNNFYSYCTLTSVGTVH